MLPLQADPNIGGLSEATVMQAYEKFATDTAVTATVTVVTVLALIFMVGKIVFAYLDKKEDKGFNAKLLYTVLQKYGLYAIFIAALPFIIQFTELAFAEVQDNIKKEYTTSLEMAGTEAIGQYVEDYINELLEVEEDAGFWDYAGSVADNLLNPFSRNRLFDFDLMALALYSVCIYILKYIYFFFCLGRYVWLIMLTVIAPVCVICALNEETRIYFYTWVKNMFICYLLIPFFLMADTLGETVIKICADSMDISVYGVFGVLGMVFIKIGLFSYVSKRAYNLL